MLIQKEVSLRHLFLFRPIWIDTQEIPGWTF